MEVILNVSHITRHDTEQNWADKNPILLKGEQGFVTEGTHAKMHKTGDGVTNWNDLEFDKAVANGGNADTVGGFTVESNVPADLKVPVQSDWNESDSSSLAHILNKPTKLSQFENDSDFVTMEDLATYATQKWVIEQGFATIEYVDGLIGLAETNLAKVVSIETEFTPDPYVPLVPEVGSDDYATQQWVIDKGYATIVYVNGLIGTSLETLSNLVV